MLGLYPDFERLIIDPCVPRHWDEYSVVKNWRGCRVEMKVANPGGVCTGVVSASLNGEPLAVAGGISSIPADRLNAGTDNPVEVLLG